MNPIDYKHPPTIPFLLRNWPVILLAFLIGWFIQGKIAAFPEFRKPAWVGLRQALDDVQPFQMAVDHLGSLVLDLSLIPKGCLTGQYLNELEKMRCQDFCGIYLKSIGIALLPLLLASLAMLSLIRVFRNIYKKAFAGFSAIQIGRMNKGIATQPAYLPSDWFSWFFCFRSISLQQDSGDQLRVYVPIRSPKISPGDTVTIVEGVIVFGRIRRFGVNYAPHISVKGGG